MKINAGMFLTQRAMLNPGQEGLGCGGRSWTFLELNRRSNRLAHALAGLGVRHGDRVGMLGLNGVEYFDLFFGLAKLGAVLVPINHRLAEPELSSTSSIPGPGSWSMTRTSTTWSKKPADRSRHFWPCAPVPGLGPAQSYDNLLARASDAEPMVTAGDDHELVILYTVWATGRPKGAALTHENFFWTAVTTMATLPRLGPTFLLPLSLFHIGGLAWLPVCMHLGMKCGADAPVRGRGLPGLDREPGRDHHGRGADHALFSQGRARLRPDGFLEAPADPGLRLGGAGVADRGLSSGGPGAPTTLRPDRMHRPGHGGGRGA